MSDWLQERISETKGMLRVRKARIAAAINAEEDTAATTSELAAITELEGKIANMEFVKSANERTRKGGSSHVQTPKARRAAPARRQRGQAAGP